MANQAVQVELVATFGQFQAQLAQAAASMKQMASSMGGSLAPVGQAAQRVGEDADKGFGKFKEGIGRAKEQSAFFVASIKELGPAGQTAATALTGLGSLFLGGGVIGAGLEFAKIGFGLVADAMKEAADKAKATQEIIKSVLDSSVKGLEALDRKLAEVSGTAAQYEFRKNLKKVSDEIKQAQLDLLSAQNSPFGNTSAPTKAIKDLQEARAKLVKDEQERQRKEAELRHAEAIAQTKRYAEELAMADKKDPGSDERAETARRVEAARFGALTTSRVAYVRGLRETREAEKKYEAEREKAGQAALDARARRYEKEQAMMLRTAQQIQDEWVAVGSTIGSALSDIGSIIGGAAQSWMAYFGQLIQKAIQLAIAMAATAGPWGWLNAAAAGIAVISAVAAVPEFRAAGGPVRAGAPYIVGEQGPELFVPSKSGGIVPNHAMGGITVNIQATDAKSVRRLLLDNGPALAEAIGKASRDGRRFG